MGPIYKAVVFCLVIALCSTVNVLTTYCQLCRENHRWWWCSFRNGTSTAFFVWIYSLFYFKQLGTNDPFACYLYYGSMTLLSIGLAVICGYVGVSSSTMFNRALYGMIVHTH